MSDKRLRYALKIRFSGALKSNFIALNLNVED